MRIKKRKLPIEVILDDKFDILIQEYFNLSEADKTLITKIIFEVYYQNLKGNDNIVYIYEAMLSRSLREAEKDEDYEKCDIIKRVLKIIRIRIKRIKNRRII